jgi:hypothetical protein
MRWVAVLGLVACGEPTSDGLVPGCVEDRAAVEVAPPDGDFGELRDGDALFCGIPPQGGAPYTPLRFRAVGPEALGDGVDIRVLARDADTDEVLGDTRLQLGVVCANAGDSAGWWTGAEVHLRYEGWTVPDLDGRRAALSFTVGAVGSPAVSAEEQHAILLDCPSE